MKDTFITALFLIMLCRISAIVKEKKIKKFTKKEINTKPIDALFKEWLKRYGKAKKIQINTPKGKLKMKIFKKNLKYIKKRNKENLPYKLTLGRFALKTDKQMKKYRGLKLPKKIL